MLERLSIKDFAVARSVTVEPARGLNVFTGETGAGKSLIVDALAFLFGARRGRDVIATGGERAVVEGIVVVDGTRRAIERTISQAGRSSARIDGTPATVEELQSLGARAVDIHGQSDQLAILRPAAQLEALDAFGGLRGQRDALAGQVRELRAIRRELRELSAAGHERERLLDQLKFEVEEIESAGLEPGEDDALQAERSRLGNVARLMEDAATAAEALDSGTIDAAIASVQGLTDRDPSATELIALVGALETAALDLRRALRNYRETLEEDPERLAFVEERLDRMARLKRKYGASIEDVIEYGRNASARLTTLESSDERIAALREQEESLLGVIAERAEELSRARRSAAARLSAELARELEQLGMGAGSLAIGFACEDDPEGLAVSLPDYDVAAGDGEATAGETHRRAFTETGVDRVEFLASFNPGESPRPLSAVASGGETSRFLLALTAVLGSAAEPRIIVFDEVDEGVGGRAGSLVGEALARLATRHQVLCITHLPQVAAYGDAHFVVAKEARKNATWSEVRRIEGDARTDELAAMLGTVSDASRAAAKELLAARANAALTA